MKFEDVKKLPIEFQPMALELSGLSHQVQRMNEIMGSILELMKMITTDLAAMDAQLDAEIGKKTEGVPT